MTGTLIPAACAPEAELFALTEVLGDMGTGVIQCGGGVVPEIKDRLMSRLSAASGRRLMYNNIQESVRAPGRWKQHLAIVQETCTQGNRAVPLCTPNSSVSFFNMKNCQTFRQLPTWRALWVPRMRKNCVLMVIRIYARNYARK